MFKSATVVSLIALAFAATAYAGNGGGGSNRSSSSIRLVLMNEAAFTTASTSTPSYGDQVTFEISTSATAHPYVNLKCFQNGKPIGEGWEGFFDGALGDRTFTLSSPQWSGGAADCTAWLDMYSNGKWKQLASTSFHVDG